MPMAAVTILIDLLTVLWVVGRVWLIRESDPIWFQIICQNDGIGEISSTIAIILTFLILKPIDLILDKIWHRPEGTEWLEVGLTENGVTVKRDIEREMPGRVWTMPLAEVVVGKLRFLKHIR